MGRSGRSSRPSGTATASTRRTTAAPSSEAVCVPVSLDRELDQLAVVRASEGRLHGSHFRACRPDVRFWCRFIGRTGLGVALAHRRDVWRVALCCRQPARGRRVRRGSRVCRSRGCVARDASSVGALGATRLQRAVGTLVAYVICPYCQRAIREELRDPISRVPDAELPGAGVDDGWIALSPALARIVYELLDAHDDTMGLVDVPRADQRWSAHVEYLRALQRCRREILAHAKLTSGT